VELVGALRYVLPAVLLLGLGAVLLPDALAWRALGALAALLGGIAGGTVLSPLALPWLPGRAFSVKGIGPGLLAAALPLGLCWGAAGPAGLAGLALLTVALSSFLALNFTGCSTFTSLSGVQRELRFAVPALVAAALLGLAGLGVG
jgi:acetyl-CoA decarbonylase/synthase complex subunit gamma